MKKAAKKKVVTKKKAITKKTVVKKAVTKKVAVKKKAVKKTTAAAAKKVRGTRTAYTKVELLNTLAEKSGVTKKEVTSVLDSLAEVMESHLKKNAVGQFTLPGLLKIKTVRKKATKARKGINPFNGEEIMFQAKPARTVVKITPLKKVKDMVV